MVEVPTDGHAASAGVSSGRDRQSERRARRTARAATQDAGARTRARPSRRARPQDSGRSTQELMRERLIESRLTPNAISLTGFALNLAAAGLVVGRLFFLAGVAFIVGSVMDTLDGRYSRMSGKGTPFGAFLDSTLDRLEEGIVLTAVAAYFASRHNEVAVAAVVAAVLASLMVSYTRARAEALGVACRVGLATRPVRVVILSAGLVFAKGASLGNFELLAPAVYVLAGLSIITVIQRIVYVRRQLRAVMPADGSPSV
jgi:CDP-diacylglycerol---glycerol-3-phosphate 3-phosphatidyltransferase